MTAEEIRQTPPGCDALFLREIAAQLAEANELKRLEMVLLNRLLEEGGNFDLLNLHLGKIAKAAKALKA